MATKAWELEKAICEVLAIEPSKTRKITIVLEAGKPARIEVEQFMTVEDENGLVRTFSTRVWQEDLS